MKKEAVRGGGGSWFEDVGRGSAWFGALVRGLAKDVCGPRISYSSGHVLGVVD